MNYYALYQAGSTVYKIGSKMGNGIKRLFQGHSNAYCIESSDVVLKTGLGLRTIFLRSWS